MRRWLLLLPFLAPPLWAEGPLFKQKDSYVDREFQNAYNDIRGLKSNAVIQKATISSATIAVATVASMTVTGTPLRALAKVQIGAGTNYADLQVKQSANSFGSGGLQLRRSDTHDTWGFLTGGDNALYVGYATNASGADAEGDFTVMGSLASTGEARWKGTATNNDAAAGYTGEYTDAVVLSASAVSAFGNNTWGDITSLQLTAGDWDVSAMVWCGLNGATMTGAAGGIGQGSGTSASGLVAGVSYGDFLPPTTAAGSGVTIAPLRKSIASTTTYYLKGLALYSAGTPVFYGYIRARRIR